VIIHEFAAGIWAGLTASPIVLPVVAVLVISALVRGVRRIRWASIGRDPVRRFSRADKAVLLARAGGRCERRGWLSGRCRRTDGLEADHVHPHSRGGRTVLSNGQVLCARHNRLKSARVPFAWELRQLAKRRLRYYPPGVSGMVSRPARRARASAPQLPDRAAVDQAAVEHLFYDDAMAARPFVKITIPPWSGQLDVWGRADTGWYGLVIWREYVIDRRSGPFNQALSCAAWIAAEHLARGQDIDYANVEPIELPRDRGQWPAPRDRHQAHWPSDGLCLGILVGGPVKLPAHFHVIGTPERRG
jgi:hypothetical protein